MNLIQDSGQSTLPLAPSFYFNPHVISLYHSHETDQWYEMDFGAVLIGKQAKSGREMMNVFHLNENIQLPDQIFAGQNNGRIFSKSNLWKGDRVIEVQSDLTKLTDRAAYKDKKSFYKNTKAPRKLAEKHELTIKSSTPENTDMLELEGLYHKWVSHRKDKKKGQRFPARRYLTCIAESVSNPMLRTYTCHNKEGELLAARIALVGQQSEQGMYGYDLMFITDYSVYELTKTFDFMSLLLIRDEEKVDQYNRGGYYASFPEEGTYKKRFPHVTHEISCSSIERARRVLGLPLTKGV